ncbi:MAG TPA: prephenate dehydrogenase/arogenate dehydrogenase family protein [Candidatus Omnitrophica bacterium]|nr:MAG: hypothetical protein A2Z81_03760 [Omnitrophica WOR_2 bacterium GWA2_45_18]OGX19981.1 MAG: hypothetical protein A2Y04_01870 [Omnitrophica WOR_2 bacterium GWC2_45_7]HBR14745.1 prephenate dehydrogenase/arogenate dehydrogenase family protein [Candidatus Omnitrophota bacterium]
MILKPFLFRKVTIVGVGLMGGSLGMAIKKHRLAREVVGYSQHHATLVHAQKYQAIDVGLTDLPSAIRNADLVVLAAPVDSIIKSLPVINPHLKRGCVITDVGSVKQEVMEAAEKYLSAPVFFVGSHPLAGSEKKGIMNARADLFDDAVCLLTPTDKTHQMARQKIKLLWTKIGCTVKYLTPEAHDEILAYTSHMPHLLAYAIMETIPKEHLEHSGQGLKDLTRIAGSSPQMWNDIFLANSKNVLKALDECVKHLSYIRKAIVARDETALLHHLTAGNEKRNLLEPAPEEKIQTENPHTSIPPAPPN